MDDSSKFQRQEWESGWEGHEKSQLLRLAALSFREKLKWLEEAQELLDSLHAQNLKKSAVQIKDNRNI